MFRTAGFLFVVHNYMLAIHVCMDQNMLKLKPSKFKFMIVGHLIQRKQVAHIFPVELLNQDDFAMYTTPLSLIISFTFVLMTHKSFAAVTVVS